MAIPQHVINRLRNSNLAENTVINYTRYIRNYMEGEWDETKVYDIEKIKNYLKELSPSSHEGFLNSLVYAFDAEGEHKREEIRQLVRNAKDESVIRAIKKLQNDKEEKIIFEEMLNIAKKTQKNPINELLVQLYTQIPPLRAATWSLVRVIEKDELETDTNYNYLNLDTGLLALNNYKTVQTYGKKALPINESLLNFIKKWWKYNSMYIGNSKRFLLPAKDGFQSKASLLNSKLTTIFGYGSSVLRHAYISYCKRMNYTDDQMKDIAYKMNTSLLTLNLKYDDTQSLLEPKSNN